MRGLSILYLGLFFLVWWNYQGYFIYLYFNRRKAKQYKTENSNSLFSIIIPTFNERELIAAKIENLKELTYKNYEVFFVDSSDDNTPELISQNINGFPNFKLMRSPERNRSYQINQALAQARGDLILITDCDGLIAEDTLHKMLSEFDDIKTGVVGAYVIPRTKYKNDILFWNVQNKMRFMESMYGHTPVVVGICYAFRRKILDKLPEDVWADDIYIPFLANFKGFNTIYTPNIIAEEMRSPINLKDFLMHKVRKTEDNIRELLRFLPEIFHMKLHWLVIYLTRFTQILVLPIFIYPFLLLLMYQKPNILIAGAVLFIISGLLQFYIFPKISFRKEPLSLLEIIKVFFITDFILLTAVIKYLFFKKRIHYSKIGDTVRDL